MQKIRNGSLDRAEVILNGLPYRFEIDTEVFVDQLVSHSRCLGPRHIRAKGLEFCGDLLYRLTDDLQAPNNGADGLAISCERVKVHPPSEFASILYGLEDVLQVVTNLTIRRQTGPR